MGWMGQAQAAVFTGSSRTAAPRATSGLHGFSAVATEPRGGLSPYLDERVRYRTPPRGPALRGLHNDASPAPKVWSRPAGLAAGRSPALIRRAIPCRSAQCPDSRCVPAREK